MSSFISFDFLNQLKAQKKFTQYKPNGSGISLYISQISRAHQKTLVIFVSDPQEARRLSHEINLFDETLQVYLFPDWETLPYDSFSPHEDLISARLKTLHALSLKKVAILIVPITTSLYRLAPPSFLAAYTFSFKSHDNLDEEALRQQLMLANYTHVSQVSSPGEFCIRGGLIDIFPMGSVLPYRIDLFDSTIESIRAFDIDTQRSLYPVKEVELLPGREFPMDEAARQLFRANFRELFEGDPSKSLAYKDIGNGIAFAGVESYLPLFFQETASIFDYLPTDSLAITLGDIEQSIQLFLKDTDNRYQFIKSDITRPVLAPDKLFLNSEQFHERLKKFQRLDLSESQKNPNFDLAPTVAVEHKSASPLNKLEHVLSTQDLPVLLCVESPGRKETLLQLFREHNLQASELAALHTYTELKSTPQNFYIVVAPLDKGFVVQQQIIFLTESDLFPGYQSRRSKHRQEKVTDIDLLIKDLAELKIGDPIVHTQHGVGRYQGLVSMEVGEQAAEFLHLEYAKNNTLYVPVSQLHVISRFTGMDPEHAPLHQLGSGQWDKARQKAAKQARDTAAELLNIYARRAARQGYEFKLPLSDYESFADSFGFEETADQAAAIQAVVEDMTSGKPMDRLVCGDVGFGKTEVALRAAFIAVANSKQVALLCPTTLLAEQHTQSFNDRFANWPIKIAELSRFKSNKEIKQAIEAIKLGSVDIIIGTHKILSEEIEYKNLGLVIIDEEHRFGVRQKERLKSLRSEVDVLTLTATPIPRTLSMSLEGIRDFSVIATPPQKRLAIKTFVQQEAKSTIREALLRELKRGGQVYFLHNEVDTIYNRLQQLEELVPEARVAVAHGQMPERELEQVMKSFYQKRFNVLLCTTIIETGINVPTANTIVIHRADKLGLAQLHQLRGRVGRSHHQAYAYLLTPGYDAITSNARKRLEAIQSMEELGSGFYLAMHDLEIRGTGEVLGDAQSGNIQEVGFQMYNDMLNEAVKALREGREPDLDAPLQAITEINLHVSALLPNDYCADVNARLGLYKRLANCASLDAIIEIQEEIIDRFGKLPDEAQALIETHKLRLLAKPLGIHKIEASEEQAMISFLPNASVDPLKIMMLVQESKNIRFAGPDRLRIEIQSKTLKSRLDSLKQVIKTLK